MQIVDELKVLFDKAISQCVDNGLLDIEDNVSLDPALERPRDEQNGDFASTIALRLSKIAKKNPREIAQDILDNFPQNSIVSSVEIAGPGFINIRLSDLCLSSVVGTIRFQQFEYAKNCAKNLADDIDKKINLEYISANPTGPMHVGHGRWAALGDSIARIMRHAGYDVFEEFYVNDHGVQMNLFAKSISVRYMQALGYDEKMPDDSYGGDYVCDIAKDIIDVDGDKWANVEENERLFAFKKIGQEKMMNQLKSTLEEFGNNFDLYFSESNLYNKDENDKTEVDKAIDSFKSKDLCFEADGALWFKSSTFGDDKDRVIIKENGEFTYFLSDCAYHYNKIKRGFDHLIDIWGADHHGYIPRMKAMMQAWGKSSDSLEVLLGQLVNLYRDGNLVRMSKRSGELISFQELIDEVGVDATRYLMLSRSADQPIDFDIELAKKQDSSNPVYYVQYAHARICSILRRAYLDLGANGCSTCAFGSGGLPAVGADEAKVEIMPIEDIVKCIIPDDVDLSLLGHKNEIDLCKLMDSFPELVANAAMLRAPHKLVHYSQDLAAAFHQFYTNCRVMDCNKKLRQARLALCDACRICLNLCLDLLGVSSPVKM